MEGLVTPDFMKLDRIVTPRTSDLRALVDADKAKHGDVRLWMDKLFTPKINDAGIGFTPTFVEPAAPEDRVVPGHPDEELTTTNSFNDDKLVSVPLTAAAREASIAGASVPTDVQAHKLTALVRAPYVAQRPGLPHGDYLREYKKKVREAAIIRFHQKRNERQFRGAQVRYQCRKKIADLRPRRKGRFVRTGEQ